MADPARPLSEMLSPCPADVLLGAGESRPALHCDSAQLRAGASLNSPRAAMHIHGKLGTRYRCVLSNYVEFCKPRVARVRRAGPIASAHLARGLDCQRTTRHDAQQVSSKSKQFQRVASRDVGRATVQSKMHPYFTRESTRGAPCAHIAHVCLRFDSGSAFRAAIWECSPAPTEARPAPFASESRCDDDRAQDSIPQPMARYVARRSG